MMYDYRKWPPKKRRAALVERIAHRFPLHSPPHIPDPDKFRLITGACFEHVHILDSPTRIGWFEEQLVEHAARQNLSLAAWVVLPNHYHLLVKIPNIKDFSRALGKLHGRTSHELNLEDHLQGKRQVWCRCSDRVIRSNRHYFTTLNYIHNNPVKHGYVDKWGDWPYSSFHNYLADRGRQWLEEIWHQHPLLKYGEKWDIM